MLSIKNTYVIDIALHEFLLPNLVLLGNKKFSLAQRELYTADPNRCIMMTWYWDILWEINICPLLFLSRS